MRGMSICMNIIPIIWLRRRPGMAGQKNIAMTMTARAAITTMPATGMEKTMAITIIMDMGTITAACTISNIS